MAGKDQGEWGRSDRVFPRLEECVEEEVAFHIEMRTRENLEKGMSPEEARLEAERRFGNAAAVRAEMQSIDRIVLVQVGYGSGFQTWAGIYVSL